MATAPMTPGAPPPANCPKCGQPVPPGARFCAACGASLAPATAPAAPGAAPVDLRQSVDQSRGTLKRLQLLVPGFRAYRQGEDLRAADSLLRRQVADTLRSARATLENARSALVGAGQFAALTDLAPLLADLQRLEGEIRHAEQGYSGISPTLRINPQQLDRLYEYDFGFAQAGDQLAQTVAPLPTAAVTPGAPGVATIVATARTEVAQLETAFKARLQAIEGVRVG